MAQPFSQRNPVPIGIIAIALGLVVVFLTLNAKDLPFLGSGVRYSAAFSEAAGLRKGEEVRIAGVKAGQVDKVDLEGDHVRVDFRITADIPLGNLTRAEIKIKHLLGAHLLMVEPRGSGQLKPGSQIPLSRTATPFNILPAVEQLSRQLEQTDTKQLARALDTFSDTLESSPAEIRASLRGLSRLSKTIAARDDELNQLMKHAKGVTGVLAERRLELTRLSRSGNLLFNEIIARRSVIHQLLVNTVLLAQQITGLVEDNRAKIGPALKNLQKVVDVLLENQQELDRALQLLAPLVRGLTDVVGNGRWFDSYVQNLVPFPAAVGAPQRAPSQEPGGVPSLIPQN